ncbi:MAG: integrase family protein [Desulfoprunum sp.]|nr:integrase family protein [Desulfoprunum sp.]
MREKLTIQRISRAAIPKDKSQTFIFDTEAPRLAVRITKGGAKSFIFETKLNRRTIRRTIGPCNAWNLEEARKEANRLQNLVNQGIDPGEQERKKKAHKDALKAEEEQAVQEAEAARRFTLGALLTLYCDHLKKSGKERSSVNARCVFKVHVPLELASLSAREITRAQVTEIIRRVREAGKDRTAGILRAYLHAAYEVAMTAETDSATPADFIPFQLGNNPVRGIKTIPVTPGERVLTMEELIIYLASLDNRPADIALKVALMAGGQRMEQILRATPADWDQKESILLLLDGKGRRTTPRKHMLPLAGKAAALVKQQAERAKAEGKALLFFSEQGGRIDPCTPGKRVKEIAKTMGGERFDLRDIRRTCETHLAKIGINQDTRAQLLSHGISGVQAKHYDRYSYLPEKLAALARWEDYLLTGGTPAEVIHLADRRAAR